MVGNPNHGKDGKFASGHNAGSGNRSVADHIKEQHKKPGLIKRAASAWVKHLQKGEDAAVLARGPKALKSRSYSERAMYRDAKKRQGKT